MCFSSKCVKFILSILLVASIFSLNFGIRTYANSGGRVRLSGPDRYSTAAAISEYGWPSGSANAILASGANFPDALAGVSLAYLKDAPVLLTTKDSLPQATTRELQRLKAENIYILGSTGAISRAVEDSLKQRGYNVNRIAGTNRYDTAVKIGDLVRQPNTDMAIITTGANFPDALAVAPFSATNRAPILFTGKDALNSYSRQALKNWGIKSAIIVGSTGIISPAVESEIKELGINTQRIAGADRYLTSLEVAKYFDRNGYKGIAVATGDNYPDALAGAVLAAKKGAPVLLVKKDEVRDAILSYVNTLGGDKNIYIFGGTGVASDDVVDSLQGIPTALKAIAVSSSQIDLKWNKAAGAVSYNVYRSNNADSGYTKIGNTTANVYSDKGLSPGKTYWYKVSAVTIEGESSYSQKVSATTESVSNNIVNGGFVANQGEWIYYSNANDNDKLYKMKADGSNVIKLCDIRAYYINVTGDWIYFLGASSKLEVGIYRLKADGSQLLRITDEWAEFLTLADNWLYYSNLDGIFKIKTDGTGKTMLTDDWAEDVNIADGWIYYSNQRDGHALYKISIDGTDKTKIVSDYVDCVNVVGDWIYYINHGIFGNRGIYKIKADGSGKIKLSDVVPQCLYVAKDYIYYGVNYGDYYENPSIYGIETDLKSGVYRMKLDGTNEMKISDDIANAINAAGNTIYYKTPERILPYRINTDGTDRLELANDYAEDLNIENGWVYYINKDDNYSIYKVKTDGSNRTLVLNGPVGLMKVKNGWIYYSSDKDLYKIKADGSSRIKINDDIFQSASLDIENGFIYYTDADGALYRIRTDSTGKQRISHYEDYICRFKVENEWVYYTNLYSYGLYRMRVDGTSRERIIDADTFTMVGDFVAKDGWIYYTAGVAIYKAKADGSAKVKISDAFATCLASDGDWIYYNDIYDYGDLYKIKSDGTAKIKLSMDNANQIIVSGNQLYYLNSITKLFRLDPNGDNKREIK